MQLNETLFDGSVWAGRLTNSQLPTLEVNMLSLSPNVVFDIMSMASNFFFANGHTGDHGNWHAQKMPRQGLERPKDICIRWT